MEALEKADYEALVKNLNRSKILHDHYLDKRGPVGKSHRCFLQPFDEKLRKKKKFKRKRNQGKVERPYDVVPLYSRVNSYQDLHDNFFLLCRDGRASSMARAVTMETNLRCRCDHIRASPAFTVAVGITRDKI